MLNYIFYIYDGTQLAMTFEVSYMFRAVETLMPYLEKVGDDKAKEYIAWTVITTAQMNPGHEIALNPTGSYKLIVEIKER